MYDLEGSDSGREWIEVYNNGSSSVDLSSYTFFEADTNHVLSGTPSLVPAGAYAVIADNPDVFSTDWPSYTGLLFDSSFSLNNSGELLQIRNAEGVTVSSVTYSSEWGASGNSFSLTKTSGSWGELKPTPGSDSSGNQDNTTQSNHTSSEGGGGSSRSNGPPYSSPTAHLQTFDDKEQQEVEVEHKEVEYNDPLLDVYIESEQVVVAGAPLKMNAIAKDENGENVHGVHYGWNFGDGLTAEGSLVEHVFLYPGTYVVKVQAYQLGLEDIESLTISVVAPTIEIVDIKGSALEIVNNTIVDIDLSNWMVVSGGQTFVFPDLSTLQSGARATFMTNIPLFGKAELVFPSGTPLTVLDERRESEEVSHYSIPSFTEVPSKEEILYPEQSEVISSQNTVHSEVASPVESGGGSSSTYTWLLALFGVIVLGIAGGYGVRHDSEIYSTDYESNYE